MVTTVNFDTTVPIILERSAFNDLAKFPILSPKSYNDYDFYMFIPYRYYSTKSKPLVEYQKNNDLAVFEVRISTLYRDVIIGMKHKELLQKLLLQPGIIVKR